MGVSSDDAVPGFSHRVRTIYKKGPNGQVQRDQAFGSELDQLLEAFDSTSAGAVEVVEVDAIMNPQREAALEAQLVQWEERVNNGGVFDAGWNKEGIAGREAKQQVLGELSKRRHDNSGVLAFAGLADGTIAPSICSNGFAVLNKTDDGYFAKGVYVTFDSAYAAIYGGGLVPLELQDPANEMVIIAAWAAVVNPYPITRRVDYTQSHHQCDLLGQTVKGGYDSHFVLVDRQGGPGSLDYQASPDSVMGSALTFQYSELVLKDEAQVMARYVLRCRKKPPAGGVAVQLEEWQVLVELRDNTGFANWSDNKDGWDTLEEHHDPSRCGGVTMESGKITKIELGYSNLAGGESTMCL